MKAMTNYEARAYDNYREACEQYRKDNAALQQQLATAQHSAKVFAGLLAQVVRFAFNDRCRISASAVQQQLALYIEEQADGVVLTVADHKPKEGIVIAREVPR